MQQSVPSRRGYLAELFARPEFDKYQTITARRALSIGQVVSVALLGAVPLWIVATDPLANGRNKIFAACVAFSLLSVVVLMTGLLNAAIGGLTELRAHDLDEVQLRQRDRAYRWAYVLSAAGTLTFMLATWLHLIDKLNVWALIFIGWMVYCVAIGCPAHVLAWTIPPLDSDEG